MKKFQQDFAAFLQPHVAFPAPPDGGVPPGPIAEVVAQFDDYVRSLEK
jgi:hypothetical protein